MNGWKKALVIVTTLFGCIGIYTFFVSKVFVSRTEWDSHLVWTEERDKVLNNTYELTKINSDRLDSLIWEIRLLRKAVKNDR